MDIIFKIYVMQKCLSQALLISFAVFFTFSPTGSLWLFSFNRYRPPTFHVQAWYDEVRDFTYPYEHECNPYCPFRCSGPVCTHYTQVHFWVFYTPFLQSKIV